MIMRPGCITTATGITIRRWGGLLARILSDTPEGMVVHHKMPLFRGGSNYFDNLILVLNPVHTENNKDLHYYDYGFGENPFGLEDL
jgi:hypothetical protein